MVNKNDLFPIGMGTWGIGGFAEKNPSNDDKKQIAALIYGLQKGMNYIATNMGYAEGYSVELMARAIEQSNIDRNMLFISQNIYPSAAQSISVLHKELDRELKILNSDYMDALSIHEELLAAIGKEKCFTFLQELLISNKIRYVHLNSPTLTTIQQAKKIFKEKLFSIEIGFNFEIREFEENGVIEFANKNNILCLIYKPLRRNCTAKHNWPLLKELSLKYGKTQNQIIFNWLHTRGFLPITKSETIEHIDKYLVSTFFKLDPLDIEKINMFRPPNYIGPKVFYGYQGEGIRIDLLSNVFDEEYERQQQQLKKKPITRRDALQCVST